MGWGDNDPNENESRPPTAADFANRPCPRCRVGVLQVVRFDPDAEHEHGQTIEAEKVLTGGAVEYHCPACQYGISEPINPTPTTQAVGVSQRGEVLGRA